MSEPQWKVEMIEELNQNSYQERKDAIEKLGDFAYWDGSFWCLSLLKNGKVCYKRYKHLKKLQNHVDKKHCGCNMPGRPDPNAIVEDQEDEDDDDPIEEISTKFTFINGIFRFVDE